jgi:hypothetical protein
MKKVFIITIVVICCNLYGQQIQRENVIGCWVSRTKEEPIKNNPSFYRIYTVKYVYSLWVTDSISIGKPNWYGFYDDCDLPAIDSLKSSGDLYFEVTPFDFRYEDKRKVNVENACAEMFFFTEKQDTSMNIYYSSRQQYATYRKLDTLPQSIQKYLVEKGIHVGFPHKEIAVDKSIIYAEPDKPTRMYLIKGDIVTVLEEKDGWIKMEYEGKKMITGWIKKEDTEK